MFTSNIGRLRFFLYSAALLVLEGILMVLCIALTIGFSGLVDSKPGPGREGMAAAILCVSLVITLARANFAWRRSRDANGSKWMLWGYIVFSFLFAILQAGTMLVMKFDGQDSTGGLNLLGLGLIGMWAVILAAKPVGGGFGDLADGLSFDVAPPARGGGSPTPASPQYRPQAAPSSLPQRGVSRNAGFGKRGLA